MVMKSSSIESPKPYLLTLYLKNSIAVLVTSVWTCWNVPIYYINGVLMILNRTALYLNFRYVNRYFKFLPDFRHWLLWLWCSANGYSTSNPFDCWKVPRKKTSAKKCWWESLPIFWKDPRWRFWHRPKSPLLVELLLMWHKRYLDNRWSLTTPGCRVFCQQWNLSRFIQRIEKQPDFELDNHDFFKPKSSPGRPSAHALDPAGWRASRIEK